MTSRERIPQHLEKYVVEQHYERYTPEDQAVWRFILRQLRSQLESTAHACYIDGLEKTGIITDEIPRISDIDQRLNEFGWGAVPVSGFIPPAAFMEFQSMSILPIASDMRTIDHILYTPAPDIVHEAAGHAPILIDPEFSDYLKRYAEVASKAILAKHDLLTYEAIRDLSDIKENPQATQKEIDACEAKLTKTVSESKFTSEAGLLGRMNWWTAEYGLIGELDNPKIFGAGLLSSIGESNEYLSDQVKKIPLSVDCVDYDYDITEKQPQLFVSPTFPNLTKVLDELSERMAYRRGGAYGLQTAIQSETLNTVQLDTGLQVSGHFTKIIEDNGNVVFFKADGPSQISYQNKQLNGHGTDYHSHGYSTPIGRVEGQTKPWTDVNSTELANMNIVKGQDSELRFKSGILVTGKVDDILFNGENPALISFSNCTVTYRDETLFAPDWGVFDMSVGEYLESVYSGPADSEAFGGDFKEFVAARVPEKKLSAEELKLQQLYTDIKNIRGQVLKGENVDSEFESIAHQFLESYNTAWLVGLELLEIGKKLKSQQINTKLYEVLEGLTKFEDHTSKCVKLGLKLIAN